MSSSSFGGLHSLLFFSPRTLMEEGLSWFASQGGRAVRLVSPNGFGPSSLGGYCEEANNSPCRLAGFAAGLCPRTYCRARGTTPGCIHANVGNGP